jgi:dTDP-glucose pyrophosphorylase/predicted transcriptional regulator
MSYKFNCLAPSDSCKEAIKVINESTSRIVLVIDCENKLLGTVTDGDIRRFILRNGNLDVELKEIMNRNFVSTNEGTKAPEALAILKKRTLRHLPIVDSKGRLSGLYDLDTLILKNEERSNAVLIMAGGEGRRLLPLTERIPKPMLLVNGRPILEIIISQCVAAGFRRFYVSVNYLKHSIMDYFGNGASRGIKIDYLEETEPLGTGGALRLMPESIESPFFVMNGDVLAKVDLPGMLNKHGQCQADMSVATSEYEVVVPYGVVETEGSQIRDVIEKPTFKYSINAGVYIVNPEIVRKMKLKTKIDMPEIVQTAIRDGLNVIEYNIDDYWIDIGLPQTLDQARTEWL